MRTEKEIREIFNRLNNPQNPEDWGLGLTMEEVLSIPEGRAQLEKWKKEYKRIKGWG